VLSWLGDDRNAGWLLILDNVGAPPALAEADRLMGRLTGGHVLLTSQLDRFARQVKPLELDLLSPDAAAAFLLEATVARRHKMAGDDAERASWPTISIAAIVPSPRGASTRPAFQAL